MGTFNAERIGNLKLTDVRRGYDGNIKKVYSEAKARWLLLSMFPSTSQSIIKKMFKGLMGVSPEVVDQSEPEEEIMQAEVEEDKTKKKRVVK